MKTAVEFHQVTKSHGSSRVIFKNFSYQIFESEKILVLGANGAGKTTLFKMVAGISVPDSGFIRWNSGCFDHVARKNLGVMLSLDLLYLSLTGRQNLDYNAHLYAIPQTNQAVHTSIDDWELHDFIDRPVATYSNGMKARLAMARATLHQPGLLLLDEPTAFLDPQGVTCLRRYLEHSTATVLVATQQASAIEEHFDRELWL